MRVNIDVSGMTNQNLTGVGVYTTQLIRALGQITDVELSASYKISRYTRRHLIESNISLPFNPPYVPVVSRFIKKNYDLFHGPDFYLPNDKSVKKVVTIHDLGVFHQGLWPDDFSKKGIDFQNYLFNRIKPDHVITVSDTIKAEVIERFPSYHSKVTSIYHGADHFESDTNLRASVYDFPYLVCVGTIEKRKNIQNLITAFAQISILYPDLRLVLVGSSHGFMGKELLVEALQNKRIIHTNFVSNQELRSIVSNATAMVYPSQYEGFGFPILEAMKLRTPVITSNFGAMQEISAGYAYTCNTLNIDSLVATIAYVLNHLDDSKSAAQRAFGHAASFTWAKTAQQTRSVYQQVFD